MRHATSNVIALIVSMGLVIVPALYAWFNIAASWDPYGNTKALKVAVANVDSGYKSELIPVRINVGETVLSALRANHQLDWQFVDSAKAVDGVKSGKYYAAIVIPKSFSADMMTLFSPTVKHATLKYYLNEKNQSDRTAYHRRRCVHRGQHHRQDLRENDGAGRTRPCRRHAAVFAKPTDDAVHDESDVEHRRHGIHHLRSASAGERLLDAVGFGRQRDHLHGQAARLHAQSRQTGAQNLETERNQHLDTHRCLHQRNRCRQSGFATGGFGAGRRRRQSRHRLRPARQGCDRRRENTAGPIIAGIKQCERIRQLHRAVGEDAFGGRRIAGRRLETGLAERHRQADRGIAGRTTGYAGSGYGARRRLETGCRRQRRHSAGSTADPQPDHDGKTVDHHCAKRL